jgi:hypothetical protein
LKSTVILDIGRPQAQVAELYADPRLATRWMDDLERIEPLSGELGLPGSQYRLVPKKGDMVFVATVLARDLPHEVRLRLEASKATVLVTGKLHTLSAARTRLVSEEVFVFKGLVNALFGFLAQSAIRKAHRRHMDAFKAFVEAAAMSGPRADGLRTLTRELRSRRPRYSKYPFTSRMKCTVPVEPFWTRSVPEPSVARRTIALLARVWPAEKLMELARGASPSPG